MGGACVFRGSGGSGDSSTIYRSVRKHRTLEMPKQDPGLGEALKGGDNLSPPLELATAGATENRTPEPAPSTPILYDLDMSQRATTHPPKLTIARTIHVPVALRKRIAADAARCARSFETPGRVHASTSPRRVVLRAARGRTRS